MVLMLRALSEGNRVGLSGVERGRMGFLRRGLGAGGRGGGFLPDGEAGNVVEVLIGSVG